MFTVTLKEKGGTAKELDFDQEQITIGRIQGNDIVLPKGNISKSHAKIVCKDEKFIIADLKSTNGTFVNGKKINAPQVILDADKVYIGDFVLTLQMIHASQDDDELALIEETGDPLPLDPAVFAAEPKLEDSAEDESSELSESDEVSVESLDEEAPLAPAEKDLESLPQNVYSASDLVQEFADDLDAPDADLLEAAAAPSLSLSEPRIEALEPADLSLPDGDELKEAQVEEFSKNVPIELDYARETSPEKIEFKLPQIDQAALQARAAVYRSVHKALASVNPSSAQDTDTRQKAENAANKALEAVAKKIDGIKVEEWAKDIAREIVGFGLIDSLFEQGVHEILICDSNRIFVRTDGVARASDVVFSSDEALNDIAERICKDSGMELSGQVISGLNPAGFTFTLLREGGVGSDYTLSLRQMGQSASKALDVFEKEGVLSHFMSDFLMTCLKTHRNILVVGANGADIVRFQNMLASLVSNNERMLILEQQKMLHLEFEQQVQLQVNDKKSEDALGQTMAFTHFDRVITQGISGRLLGAVLLHGGQVQSGHILSCNGSSVRHGLSQMGLAIQALENGNAFATKAQVANAIDIVIHLAKDSSGQERVTEITEVLDVEVDFITLQTLFKCDVAASLAKGEGVFHSAGHPPRFYDDLQRWGISVNHKIFTN